MRPPEEDFEAKIMFISKYLSYHEAKVKHSHFPTQQKLLGYLNPT